jgi:putative FmdB family regulatory protein
VPIYGYRCPSCAHDFEVTQRMTDLPQTTCPVCGGAATRQFFPTGIHFKGSGFYKTDSRSAAASTAPAAAGDAEKAPATATTKEPGSTPAKDSAPASPPPSPSSPNSPPPKAASTAD